MSAYGSIDGGAHGTGGDPRDELERRIQDAGQAAIVHHAFCSRPALRYELQADGSTAFVCDECRRRVTVGPDGRPIDEPSTTAAADAPAARSGPPPDLDRPRDRVVQAVVNHEGAWPPTQGAISESLGWASDGRRIRQVMGPRGWRGILADASRRRR